MEDPDTAYPLREFDTAYQNQLNVKGTAADPTKGQAAKAAYLAWAEKFP